MAWGYIGVALVICVGAALLLVVAGRASDRARLFLRCLRWGVATGAATGAVVGVTIPLVGGTSALSLVPATGFFGAVIGVLVSLIPTVIGAVYITDRHPYPSAEDDVQSDVTAAFGAVAGGLDVILIVVLAAGGNGLSSIVVALPFMVAGNACVLLMLGGARRSIGRLSGQREGASTESGVGVAAYPVKPNPLSRSDHSP